MEEKETFVYGRHAVLARLRCGHSVRALWVQSSKEEDASFQEILTSAKVCHIPIRVVSRNELTEQIGTDKHQGVALSVPTLETLFSESDLESLFPSIEEPVLILVLDGIQDPRNLGACFRTADAAGVHAIIVPKDRAVGVTPIVAKTACGATETVPMVKVTNLARTLRILKDLNIWMYGTDAEAPQSLYQTKLPKRMAWVLGAEGSGLRRLTKEHCDALVSIPMRGRVESLNVSVATALCLYESVRQQETI